MKTLREFDYNLWAIVDNGKKRYFARVKATGEETEITLDKTQVVEIMQEPKNTLSNWAALRHFTS